MDILNLRYRNNAWRPVPEKEKLFNKPITYEWQKIWIHVQDDIENYIGIDTDGNLRLIDFVGDSTLIKNYTGTIKVEFIKRFMVVVYDGGMDRYIYKDDEYSEIQVPEGGIYGKVLFKDKQIYVSETSSTAEAILGKYRKKLKEINDDTGELTGGIMYRLALKMFDGSYVFHTIPYFVDLGLQMIMTEQQVEDGGNDNDLRTVKFYASLLKFETLQAYYTDIDNKIYTSLVIFACKNQSLYQFDEETFDEDTLEEKVTSIDTGNFQVDFEDIYDSVGQNFKDMADSINWYKIHEISISEIQDSADATFTDDIDTKGFYTDFATKETLPVDQFSYHSLIGNIISNYNSRLIIADTTTKFGEYKFRFDTTFTFPVTGYTLETSRKSYFLYTIDTNEGEKKILSSYFYLQYVTKNGEATANKYFMIPRVIGYPDSRCTKIDIISEEGTSYYIVKTFRLEKSTSGNFSYYHSEDFSTNPSTTEANYNYEIPFVNFSSAELINIALYNSNQLTDTNRVQVSEVNNPFFFPAENSYQVGTGKIRGVASNTEPLSTGQFGEYPLQVFTSKGIWALLQGQGDVLFSNVVPSGSEVVKEGGEIISIGNAVIFQNEKNWIFALSGRDPQKLSDPLDNPQDFDFQSNLNFQYFTSHANIVQIDTKSDPVGLKVYLLGAKMGFDKENNELVVSNDSYSYSYVFSFDSGFWYRIGESYSVLVNNYPFLEGLNNRGLIRLSSEVSTDNVPVLFVTREQSLDFNEIYKKLDRSLLRVYGSTDTDNYFGYYIFGSDDLYNWQLTSGNDRKYGDIKDIRASRSHKKWKYYIFVIAAELSTDSILTFIDTQFTLKANRKLR